MVSRLLTLFLAPVVVISTSLEYYRSASCDAQSSSFFLGQYTLSEPLLNDKTCHQAPARTLAMKLVDTLDPACFVLAYGDNACNALIGAVPASGKCVAATNARIGSWQLHCNNTIDASSTSPSLTYAPGDLKRRGKRRLANIRDLENTAIDVSVSRTITVTLVASSEISSAMNASASQNLATTTNPSMSADAASSSVLGFLGSATRIEYNSTSYVTAVLNSSHVLSTLKTIKASSTAAVTAARISNGTAILHKGGSSLSLPDAQMVVLTALCNALIIMVAIVS